MATDEAQFQKALTLVTAFLAIVGVGLIVASFATDHWIVSHPSHTSQNRTKGNFSFGLFIGYKSLDFGLGPRIANTKIKCDTTEYACAFEGGNTKLEELIQRYENQTGGEHKSMEAFGLFDFRLYVATLVMLVMAIVWGLVTIGFSIFNVFGRPIETITGRTGLYLWNFLALVFDVTAMGIFLGLYFSQLKKNILSRSEMSSGFSSEDETDLDYSFFFIPIAAGAFILNIVLLAIVNRGCSCNYMTAGEKEVDNGMILY